METLIRYRVLLGLIWFCTVYLCPTKRMLGICGLIALYEKMPFSMSEKWRKASCVIFFLGYFFLTTLDCLVSYGPRCEKNCFRGWGGGGGGSTKSVSNQSPQLKRLAWKLKFHLQQVYIWYFPKSKKKKALIRLRGCAGWSAPVLFTNPWRQGFSRRGPYYSCIYDPCNSERTASHDFFLFCFF